MTDGTLRPLNRGELYVLAGLLRRIETTAATMRGAAMIGMTRFGGPNAGERTTIHDGTRDLVALVGTVRAMETGEGV